MLVDQNGIFNGTETKHHCTSWRWTKNHTVSSLTAGTRYTFTVFSVFENVRSSGVSLTAVTAPSNTVSFSSIGQDETSITLQWNKVNNYVSFILQFNVPTNTVNVSSTGQDETSVTLHWSKVNINVNFILQFNGTETYITAPAGDGPINHTVSSLTAGTRYTFTVFSVFENVRSSGVSITAVTAPTNTVSFRSTGQNETSISLQWNKVNNNVSFILQFNGTETYITAPAGDGPINHTVSSLTAGTRYTFTVFSVFENVRSSGVSITAVTAPANTVNLISTGQNETSIRLQWNKVNNNVSFILQFNGTETNITAPAGDGPINHTVSSLTAGTRYTFTVFSVFENVRSSGVSITAVTAPPNTNNFRTIGHNKTSISLQWNKVNNNVSFILQFNGTEINISAPVGDGPITYTVSSLTAGTTYTFTLFSVFENVRSSGVNVTAVTDPHYVVALDIKLKSSVQLSESEMHQALEEFLRQNGLPPQVLSVKVQSAEP
ncbi:tenascin-like [Larimichthys crocea]|uniref:tenascin-like n=1 Tax=Larimichthys crocea TaxID=215358 RepID=UPI000F5EBA4A|nr:tenascin-like [Larimichthys crocea]